MTDGVSSQSLRSPSAVVIGGSAGGFEALQRILAPLPSSFLPPIMVVLHRSPSSDALLPQLLGRGCRLVVKEVDDKEPIRPGIVYIAPPNYHTLVELDHTLSLSVDQPVCHARPSIDVLFETAADAFADGLVGILLTGANRDGTSGLARIRARGGRTVAQHPDQAQVPTMPVSAIRNGVVDSTLSLEDITALLIETGTSTAVPVQRGIRE